ncbi:MAG: ATP-dependent Clp protease proteolytic subunit [Polyangiales bacterium]
MRLHEPSAMSPEPSEASAGALLAERLLAARTLLVFGEITPLLAERTCAQLLALAAVSGEPIRVLISSPGGHVESGDAIHDVVRFIEPTVNMIGTGWVASAGALIYVATPREHRFALPNTRFLLHEPSGGVSGAVAEIEIEARQVLAMRARLLRIFAAATGQPVEKLARETARNHWLTVEDAVEYGLVGHIIDHAAELSR